MEKFKMNISNKEFYNDLKSEGMIVILRGVGGQDALRIASVLAEVGIHFIEIALKNSGDFDIVKSLEKEFGGDLYIGTGTVTTIAHVDAALDAGSKFLLSPNVDSEVLTYAMNKEMPMIPGAFTPSEIMNARNLGAEIIKFFPAQDQLSFFKNLAGPLGTVNLMPVGGVDLKNIPQFQAAGARIFGIGSSLITQKTWSSEDLNWLKLEARKYTALIKSMID